MCVDSIWKVLIGKCGKRMETSGAIQPVWGNTARAAMAGLRFNADAF